jgi:hypothetical protein
MLNNKIIRSWIPNKLNVERWNKKKNYTKGLKKTRVRKSTNLIDKNFQLEGLIELKNSFNNRKKSKEWQSNWKKITKKLIEW